MLEGLRGLLLDLDGVLWIDNEAVPGARETLDALRARGLVLRFITNTSLKNKRQLLAHAASLGFRIDPAELITSAGTAVSYIQEKGYEQGFLMIIDDLREDLRELRETKRAEHADYILMGDIEDGFSRAMLNRGFVGLKNGAELIAFHKNRYWKTKAGLSIDLGGYVALLEYASGVPATILGKPSPLFFRMALLDMGFEPGAVAMIGDDLESDIMGGRNAGLRTILVLTGKTQLEQVDASGIRPDSILESVNQVMSDI
ncbi:HAD-IIA family hydrolase [bacterium]|nr:HAD-IIA family hydrolase [candidate division CSSED10-310 bacterium]